MDKDLLGMNEESSRDDNYYYSKYFIDLNGNKIFVRRINKEEIDPSKPIANYYQRHPDLAETIVNGD